MDYCAERRRLHRQRTVMEDYQQGSTPRASLTTSTASTRLLRPIRNLSQTYNQLENYDCEYDPQQTPGYSQDSPDSYGQPEQTYPCEFEQIPECSEPFEGQSEYDPNMYDYGSCPPTTGLADDCPLPSPDIVCPPPLTCPTDSAEEVVCDPKTDTAVVKKVFMCGDALRKANEIISSITPYTLLDEFMIKIAEHTPDQGETMYDLMSSEVNDFKALIREIYAHRNDNVSDLLLTEQRTIMNKYERWTKELTRKTNEALENLQRMIPGFDINAYNQNPLKYLQSIISHEENAQASTAGRELIIGRHKRTWLLREAEKVECQNEEKMCRLNKLMARLAELTECLATKNKKIAAYNRQLESHATCLRNKLSFNEKKISCLLAEVDALKEATDDCPVIEPDEILTPYPRGYDYC